MSSQAEDLIRRHRYTADEYQRMGEAGILDEDDRVELIEGEIIDMTPIGSRHASVVARLQRILERAVGDSAIVWTQNPVRLSARSEPEPDLALLAPRPDFYSSAHPTPTDVLLIVEVADASLRYDREIKLPLYARHGVPEVWLVDLDGRAIMRCRRPGPDGYKDVAVPAELGCVPVPGGFGASVDLSALLA